MFLQKYRGSEESQAIFGLNQMVPRIKHVSIECREVTIGSRRIPGYALDAKMRDIELSSVKIKIQHLLSLYHLEILTILMENRFDCEVVFHHPFNGPDHWFSLQLLQIFKRFGLVAGPETTVSVIETHQ
jgi:hypothetical protein